MKLYYDLESQNDIEGLEKLHFKICLGIAKSKKFSSTRLIPHYEMSGQFNEAIDFKDKEPYRTGNIADDTIPTLTDNQTVEYNKLGYSEKRDFMEIYSKGYCDGYYVPITYTRPQTESKYAAFHKDQNLPSINIQHFPELMNWIEHKTPFIHIGRIMFFKTTHHLHSDMHYDRRDNWNDGRHHFIWFNPFKMKKFFLLEGYKKIYVDSKAVFFDMGAVHGAEPSPFSTYALRIDGQLSEDFCKANNILWKKR
jgi:hypothetical protein